MGGPLNLQPVLIRSSHELNCPVRIRQPVIPRKDVRSHEGIEVANVWCCTYVDSQSGMKGRRGGETHLRSDRKSELLRSTASRRLRR